MTKIEALAKFLECEIGDLSESSYDDSCFEYGRKEYLVLTEDEATSRAKEYILNSVWAFNPEFLASHSKVSVSVIKAIQVNEKCEDNNDALTSLIDDLDHFVDDAICSDGRGNFLNTYDGEENESADFLIYRVN